MKTEKFVKMFGRSLGVTFPGAYVKFLNERGSAIVDGFRVAGIPIENVSMDVGTATNLLRLKRPDLPETLVAIIPIKTFVCCLDLSRATEEDAPLVEVDLESKETPKPTGKTFSEWIGYHEKMDKRFRKAWARIRNRQAEAKGKNRIQDWSAPIFRVRDYIIGIGAFRFNYKLGCLEADEFLPLDQPHVKKGEPVKILLSEALARARDYSGSLNVQFTRDVRENENGTINPEIGERRVAAPIPEELMELAKKYSVYLPQPEKGFITHEDAKNLWFASFEFPKEVEEKIIRLEEVGYLKREIVTEIISLGFWTREETIWTFLNVPRPEALIMGSDCPEDRLSYVEYMNYGRDAIMATRLKYAVMAEMNGGFTLEEIEEVKINCEIEPKKDFWYLWCTEKFYFPELWLADNISKRWFEANKPVLLLCRPHIPGNRESEMERLQKYLDILVSAEESVQAKCLVLSNECISPYYCKFLDEIKSFVKKAQEKNIQVIFAPTRTDLYLDQEIQNRMHKVKNLTKLPSRQEVKRLQIFEVTKEWWRVPEDSRMSRAIQNASQSALIFAQQLVKRRDVKRYEMEFSLMCEVVEREASQNHKMIAEVDGEESQVLSNALRHDEEGLKGVSFSFVAPEEMPLFIAKVKNEKLFSKLKDIQGGIVVIVKIWEYQFMPPKKIENSFHKTFFVLPLEVEKRIDADIKTNKDEKKYASNWDEIERAHSILRQSLEKAVPFAIASIMGRVRSGVFTEMVRDYIYQMPETAPIMLPIAYGDGSQGGPFSLFSLPEIERPKKDQFFVYNVGLVSLRHSESDKYVDRHLVRNRDIQNRANATDQEELSFNKTYECLDELLRYIRGEIDEKDSLSSSLRVLLGWKQELKQHRWLGLHLNVFHTTGLESAGIGTYRAIIDILKKYRGEVIITPRIMIPNGQYKQGRDWF